ncbi:ABC transporter ATP-binding protein [Bosea sp. 2KB_26]|uniref:ABC transporter ATP-binding protein n=1 Tax=Bosea sp. 2KB_26 TaxID=3237475 RepID=UPI003F916C9C
MLQIQSLQAGYGALPVLHGIDMSIGKDEAVAIVGPNGAGKTTLVRTLCGLVKPMAGRVLKDGADLTNLPPHRRAERGIAVVLENRNLFVELTVRDNLRLAESAGGKASAGVPRFSLEEVLTLFPAVKERYHTSVGLLSGGQQQMVAIARALLLQPDLLILDELTTGLAPKIVKEILGVLNNLRTQGMAILLVEQSITIAAEMTDRAYVLSVGRVAQEIKRGEWQAVLEDDSLIKAYLHG